ncbi:hypothetical protein GYMLUDRAFT_49614 [Collybiopsis luxurians FD-317 M1]|uniref:Nephrocystin 3-like N-terminal domain-containing protein n=1 Tax=Collybiopsis luxurians FD-317 M1 TaxID=944289 RepID=A0A0D0BEA9_9AGAR|nr:hypothetical protein GYMLUDRAFT_49614 [Collybiopsis luxurians FD-317 M1]
MDWGVLVLIAKDEKEALQKWLNAPDCATNFQAADDKRTKGTGQWMLKHPQYIKWKNNPSMLWIQGKAGSGKTILFTTIIRDLEQEAPENVWYHYFDSCNNTGQKSNFRGYLLSLMLQKRLYRLSTCHRGLSYVINNNFGEYWKGLSCIGCYG